MNKEAALQKVMALLNQIGEVVEHEYHLESYYGIQTLDVTLEVTREVAAAWYTRAKTEGRVVVIAEQDKWALTECTWCWDPDRLEEDRQVYGVLEFSLFE